MSFLSLCLNATYFSYTREFSTSKSFGTAMGSLVSVVVANLVVEDIVSQTLSSFSPSPIFWNQYIDDACAYVRSLSEAIQRVLLNAGVRVTFQPHTTLRQQLVLQCMLNRPLDL